MRLLIPVLIAVLTALIFGCGGAEDNQPAETRTPVTEADQKPSHAELAADVLPRTEELAGFEQVGTAELISKSEMHDFVGPDSPVFERFGVLGAASADYMAMETSQQFVVDVYIFPSISEAFGIYSELSSNNSEFVAVGAEGFIDSGSLVFFKERFLARVTGYEETGTSDTALVRLGQTTALQIEGENAFPAAIEVMPSDNRIEHSCRYNPDSFMGYDFFSPVYTCDYRLGDSVSTLFFAPQGTEAEIILYTNGLKERGNTVVEGTAEDLKLYFTDDDSYGRIIMSAKIGRIAGVLNTPDRPQGMELLMKLWDNPVLSN